MSDKPRTAFESRLLEELAFDPSRAAPAGAAARVRQRMEQTIAELDGGRREGGPMRTSARVSQRALGAPRSVFRLAAMSAAALLLASGVGAAIHAAIALRAERRLERMSAPVVAPPSLLAHRSGSSVHPAPSLAPATNATPVGMAEPAVTQSPVTAPNGVVPRAEPRASTAPASNLVAERALVDEARRAFGAGEYEAAERALNVHARRYPGGLLAEEREALAVRMLAADGRADEARDRASRFLARFPRSFFATSVRDAVRSNP